MNVLGQDLQVAVLRALVEGNSLRATARMTGVARNTIACLLRDVGAHCKNHHDRFVTGVASKRVQMDEIWSFCGKKEKNVPVQEKGRGEGDVWTWVGIDADSKLVIAYRSGLRDRDTGFAFVQDLADRLSGRVQISSDGLPVYTAAVERSFGWNGADFGRIVKVFGVPSPKETVMSSRRYSPSKLVSAEKEVVFGKPDMAHVATSYVERQNLTMRMGMRRFTRLTNGFSKKIEFHQYAIALHYTFYNYCRPHSTLSKATGTPTTPAMASGLADRVWGIEDILFLLQGN